MHYRRTHEFAGLEPTIILRVLCCVVNVFFTVRQIAAHFFFCAIKSREINGCGTAIFADDLPLISKLRNTTLSHLTVLQLISSYRLQLLQSPDM